MAELAATFAIDYKALLEGCMQGDDPTRREKSMSVMLWLSAFGGIGGEYGEEHAGWVGEILKRIGDDTMADLVADQPEVLRTAAGREIAYAFALFEPDAGEREVAAFARRFPRTYKSLGIGGIVAAENGRGEQILEGDGQQGGEPESKSEGEEKSKKGAGRRPQ